MSKYCQLNVGDSVGGIYKKGIGDDEKWELVEDVIYKITITKKYGRRYFTKSRFYPLDADDVDSNTVIIEDAIGKGFIITMEVFGLNEKTRPFAENWVEWANANKDKAVSILQNERWNK